MMMVMLIIMMMMMMIVVVVVVVVEVVIVIALEGAIRDFLKSPHCATNCLQHVHSSGPGAIVCELRATHRTIIKCNLQCATWYEGTARLLSLTEFKSLYVIG